MAEVTIDVREEKLVEILNAKAGGHHVRALPVGDVQVDYWSGRPGWLTERKPAPDLQASLCDGRWAEQRSRLLKCGRTAVYIIEGDVRVALLARDEVGEASAAWWASAVGRQGAEAALEKSAGSRASRRPVADAAFDPWDFRTGRRQAGE